MPASRLISGRMMLAIISGATSASSSAAISPIKPPSTAAPSVASSEATIMGSMPNSFAEGCQVVPVMKFHRPISRSAGTP